MNAPRDLGTIAREIEREWDPVWFGARPYLRAMRELNTLADHCGADSARAVVLYFLSNAKTWRGEAARRIKAELNAMLKAPK